MNKQHIWQVAKICLDAAAFSLLPGLFLAVYVLEFHISTSSIWPHFQWISLLWISLVLLRSLFVQCLPAPWVRVFSSFAIAAGLAGLILYYILVWVGLNSWGRVISWDLIVTYAVQLPALCETLGISPAAVVAGLIGLLLLIWLVVFWYLRPLDWLPTIFRSLSGRMAAEVIFALSLIVFLGFWQMIEFPRTDLAEPFALTFHPNDGAHFQSHHLSKYGRLDELESEVRRRYRPNPSAVKRNVFVIVVDALRADHLGFNGYSRATSPNLDALAQGEQAERPQRMYSACAESACGLMSLASSRHPHHFSSKPMTLQEVLVLNGYKVHMLLSGDHTHFYGLREAYGKVDSYYDGSMAKGMYMNDDQVVIDRLAELGKWQGEPVFMQFHLMSAHGLGRRSPEFNKFQPAKSYYAHMGERMMLNKHAPEESYINFYDNGVLHADGTIKEILQMLGAQGYLDNALVIVTADHGELLGEHGYYTHARTVYEPVLNIPFLMLRYGYKSQAHISRQTIASQVDIAPTVLAELDIPAPDSWSGLAMQAIHDPSNARKFIYFEQQADYGLVDLSNPSRLWKYSVDARTRAESVSDVSSTRTEEKNQIEEIPAALKAEWVEALMELQMAAYEYASKDQRSEQVLH